MGGRERRGEGLLLLILVRLWGRVVGRGGCTHGRRVEGGEQICCG
jgi:hypothetical protein